MEKQIRSAYQGCLFGGSLVWTVSVFIDLHEGFFDIYVVQTLTIALVLGLAFALEAIKNVERSNEKHDREEQD